MQIKFYDVKFFTSKNILSCKYLEMYVIIISYEGSMPERLMGTDCKSVSTAYVGSNPTRPILFYIS